MQSFEHLLRLAPVGRDARIAFLHEAIDFLHKHDKEFDLIGHLHDLKNEARDLINHVASEHGIDLSDWKKKPSDKRRKSILPTPPPRLIDQQPPAQPLINLAEDHSLGTPRQIEVPRQIENERKVDINKIIDDAMSSPSRQRIALDNAINSGNVEAAKPTYPEASAFPTSPEITGKRGSWADVTEQSISEDKARDEEEKQKAREQLNSQRMKALMAGTVRLDNGKTFLGPDDLVSIDSLVERSKNGVVTTVSPLGDFIKCGFQLDSSWDPYRSNLSSIVIPFHVVCGRFDRSLISKVNSVDQRPKTSGRKPAKEN